MIGVRKFHGTWATSAVVAVSASLVGTATAQEPSIAARFVVESQTIDTKAGGPDAADSLEAFLSNLLVATGQEHFPYLHWRDAPSAAGAVPRLEVAVVELTAAAGPSSCTRVDLTFRAVLADGPHKLVDDVTVYPPCGHVPDRLEDLESDLGGTITDRFDNQDFRRSVQQGLLSNVALADRFMLDLVKRNVVVPIRWKDLRADSTSELQLRFVVQRPDEGEELDATTRLGSPLEITAADTAGRSDVGAWMGFARWRPRELVITDLITLEVNIIPELDTLTRSGALVGTRAFMASYAPSTSGGNVECLDDCGGGE